MKGSYLSAIILTFMLILFTQTTMASTKDAARILENKAKNYAIHYANNPNFDLKLASQELSQNGLDLAKIYQSNYTLHFNLITSQQCLEEVAKLGVDSQMFLNKAMLGQYKKIAIIDGNIVMLIAGGAGSLTYTILDKGNFCHIDKSIHDAYWAANIILIVISDIDMLFS